MPHVAIAQWQILLTTIRHGPRMSLRVTRIDPMVPEVKSVRPRIDFLVTVQNTSGQRFAIQDARALVGLAGPGPGTQTLGHAFALGPTHWELGRQNGEAVIRLAMFLDAATVQGLERVRGGQKLRLILDLTLVGLPLDGDRTSAPGVRVDARGDVTIGKSDWVDEFLPNLVPAPTHAPG